MSLSLPEINISGKKIEVPVIFISFRNVAQPYTVLHVSYPVILHPIFTLSR